MVRRCGRREARRRLDVNFFSNSAVEEGCLYIEVQDFPTLMACQGENAAESSPFNDRSKGFTKIDTFFLLEAARDKSRFELGRCAVYVRLDFKNPLGGYCLSVGR